MRSIYVQCAMGAAGDMLMAALWELLDEEKQAAFLDRMAHLGLPGVTVQAEPLTRNGIKGTRMHVLVGGQEEDQLQDGCGCGASGHEAHAQDAHVDGGKGAHGATHAPAACEDGLHRAEPPHAGHADGGHSEGEGRAHADHDHGGQDGHTHTGHGHGDDGYGHGHSAAEIRHLIEAHLPVSDAVKSNALAIYDLIAQAEAAVHGETMEHIHFHEVGTLDAVADVVGCCLLLEMLGADRITVSPIHVGSGTVRCAHGLLPVPAPATARILTGIPIYSGEVEGELCTPTGAAILRHFGQSFGPMPPMTVEKVGYGMGSRVFPGVVNCVRVFLGETDVPCASGDASREGAEISCAEAASGQADAPSQVIELSCNLDDMCGEDIGLAAEILLEAGALDVYTQAITMKKSRPAIKLSVLARPEDEEKMTTLLFRHTTTIGVRVEAYRRHVLRRETLQRETPWGPVTVKRCWGYGAVREKPEMDQVAALVRTCDVTADEVRQAVRERI